MEGCVGLQAYAADCGIKFLEPPRRSYKCAARSECGNKMRDAAGGLLPNLVGGSAIVGLPVRGIAVLVRIKVFLRIFRNDFVHFANRTVGALIAGSDHQLSAESGEDALALVRSAIRQAKLHGIT